MEQFLGFFRVFIRDALQSHLVRANYLSRQHMKAATNASYLEKDFEDYLRLCTFHERFLVEMLSAFELVHRQNGSSLKLLCKSFRRCHCFGTLRSTS